MTKTLMLCQVMVLLFFCCGTLPIFAQGQLPSFEVNGDAVQLDELCYQLTPAAMSQSGSIWCLDQIDLNNNFDLTISINVGCMDSNGADGMVFGLQPVSTNVGTLGGGLGFEGITPSIGIELDTYQNGNNSDPVFDHIAIISDGILNHTAATNLAGPIAASSTNDNIEDCNDHLLRVTWNTTTHTLTVYFDCILRLTYTADIVNTIFNGDGNVFWGFTAATGALTNVQSMCLLSGSFFETIPNVNICAGGSAQLIAPAGENYSWSPATGLNNPAIQNPTATPNSTTTYIVSFEQNCQILSDTVTVTVNSADVTIAGNDSICVGANTTLDAGDFFFYQWSTGATTATIDVNVPGSYTVTVYGDGGCSGIDTFAVANYPIPSVMIDGNLSICNGSSTILSTVAVFDAYLWSNGSTTPTIEVAAAGSYTVTVTNENACTGSAAATVVISDNLLPQISGDLGICPNGSTTLSTTEFDGGYVWSTGGTTQSIEVAAAGTYSVTVSSSNACSGSTTATVVSYPAPTPSLEGDTVIINDGNTTLTVVPAYNTYQWSNGATTAAIDVAAAGIYSVTVTNEQSCTGIDSISIMQQIISPVIIPTAFSPNNDGVNDEFRVFANNTTDFSCAIYNRWGQRVFESNNITLAWDGKYKGMPQEAGVYAYYIIVQQNNGTQHTYKGNVTIIY